MSKKKKNSHKKVNDYRERSPAWGWIALFLVVLWAIFTLLGGFGIGGALPTSLFDAAYWLFGRAGYIMPITIVLAVIWKLKHEEKKTPKLKVFGLIGILTALASLAHVISAEQNPVTAEWVGEKGGNIGGTVGNLMLGLFSEIPAFLLLLIILTALVFAVFGISPKVLLHIFDKFKREPRGEGEEDLASLKAHANGFKLNEGVPVEHNVEKPSRMGSLKNTAQKLAGTDDHAALTTANDPNWQFPSMSLLNQKQDKADAGDVEGNAEIIRETFANFNIDVDMEGANVGPRVTQFTLKPPAGVKLTKITALENNIALDLAAQSIRMEAPIPGKRAVGIEVPNRKAAIVRVASVFESKQWNEMKSPLAMVIGKDIAGVPVVAALDKMPHLLVAGQTGSGKSVMINTILTSLIYRNSPADLKMILVDPKQVELTPYNDIPHLLTPVITEPEKCISALKWAVAEMERRLKAFAAVSKRNIAEYNNIKGDQSMPYIVIVIDELADLMMMAARDVESLIVRLAQKARASGIHLVLATQRPSVDVITGLIKANIPARISFTVASQVDSRTIIDGVGAEKLLGMGDMLFSTSDMPKPKRVQGAFIGDDETMKVTDFMRMQRPPQYDNEVVSQPVQLNGKGGVVPDYSANEADDDMWQDAVRIVIEMRKASTSLLQRRLRIGYGRAARIIETMEEQGIIGPADGSRPRDVLVSSYEEVFGGGTHQIEVQDGDDVYGDPPEDEYLSR